MPPYARATSRSIWFWAILLTLLLHVAGLVALQLAKPFAARSLPARAVQPIELVFAQPPAKAESARPNEFTELPSDREDARPENPDFLSNVDSRAQDNLDGGEADAAPRMEGDSEAPHVELVQAEALEPVETERPPPVDPDRAEQVDRQTAQTEGQGALTQPAEEPSPQDAVESSNSPSATDFSQREMFRPAGNAAQVGDLSLNTVAWDYAPWLQRFQRDFHQHWVAPYAYHLGVIHGWNLVEIVVRPDGKLHKLTLLSEEGHESLGLNSMSSLRATAPYRPLPADFPEDFLILHMKLIYPERRR